MKKIISLILLSILLCLSLVSCDLSFFNLEALGLRDKKEQTVVMYGAVVYINDLNNTCVFFANGGHITMPRLKSGEAVSEYEVGDLVRASFTTDEYGIAIMESFPGQIGVGADEIVIKEANVNIYYVDSVLYYTDEIPEGLSLSEGDEVTLFSTVEGAKKELTLGKITETSDGLFTIEIDSFEVLEALLKHRFEYGVSVEKK